MYVQCMHDVRMMYVQCMEDLSLPQVIHVESMDSMDVPRIPWPIHVIFFGSRYTQIQFSVHGLSTEDPHGIMNLFHFHGIHPYSPRIPRGLSPWIIHGLY